jgi:hypothetical protein
MSTTTRVPAATDVLVSLMREKLSLLPSPDVEVYDGALTVPLSELSDDAVLVGGNTGDRLAATGERTGPNGLAPHDRETALIGLVVSSLRDIGETKLARDRCAEILGLLEAELKKDMTLGGVVNRARLGPSFLWSTHRAMRGETERIEVAVRIDVEIMGLL